MISNHLAHFVPTDLPDALLIGRIWRNTPIDGPSVVVVREGQVYGITASARHAPGSGFTHHLGDKVTIGTPQLGALANTVQSSTEIAPWRFSVRAFYEALAGKVIRLLIAGAIQDPELATLLHERFILPRRRLAVAIIDHAIERGELPDGADSETAIDMLMGRMWYRQLVTGARIRVADESKVVNLLIDGLRRSGKGDADGSSW